MPKGKKRAPNKELQALRRYEAMKKRCHDMLEREQKYGIFTRKNHEKTWRKILMKIGLEVGKDRLNEAWNLYERAVDLKDFTISLRMDELSVAYDQYLQMNKLTLISIDDHVSNFINEMKELKSGFFGNVEELRTSLNNEMGLYKQTVEEHTNHFNLMMFAMQKTQKQRVYELATKHDQSMREVVSYFTMKFGTVTDDFEETFNAMYQECSETVVDYFHLNSKRFKQFMDYENTHAKNRQESKETLLRLERAGRRIEVLKRKFYEVRFRRYERVTPIRKQVEYLKANFEELKEIMEEQYILEQKCIDNCVVLSSAAMKHMNKLLEKGSKILNIMQVCRRLETLNEKTGVIDYPQTPESAEGNCSKLDRIVKRTHTLTSFWTKISVAHASLIELNEEKQNISAENNKIREYIQAFNCGCVQCPKGFKVLKENDKINVVNAKETTKHYIQFHDAINCT